MKLQHRAWHSTRLGNTRRDSLLAAHLVRLAYRDQGVRREPDPTEPLEQCRRGPARLLPAPGTLMLSEAASKPALD